VSSLLDQPVQGFLDQLAARTPAPGGGGATAVTGAMAAGLVAMAARFSARQLAGAGELADQADTLRRMAAQLADMDARAYTAVLEAGPGQRPEALLGAALVPLEIAAIGARVAALAAQLAEAGNPNLRGDAVTGALLAAASARSAACLVDINVRLGGLDPGLSQRAAQAAADAGDAAGRATMSAERAPRERLFRAAGVADETGCRVFAGPAAAQQMAGDESEYDHHGHDQRVVGVAGDVTVNRVDVAAGQVADTDPGPHPQRGAERVEDEETQPAHAADAGDDPVRLA
jgi:formiminotetrahydrofolate cyclodeaminase